MTNRENAYVPLNNLDLLDEAGTLDPYTSEECRFDESPEDRTLEEEYAGASEEKLSQLAEENFFEGLKDYRNRAAKLRKSKPPLGLLPEAERYDTSELMERSLPFVVWRVCQNHLSRSSEVTALDRVQTGSLYVGTAAKKYDPAKGVSFIALFEPHLDGDIRQSERGGAGIRSAAPIIQTDLIRIPHSPDQAYYRLKEFHANQNAQFGRELEVAELEQLGEFSSEEFEEYQRHLIKYVPLHRIVEAEDQTGVAFSDAFLDDDPGIDPVQVAAKKVPSEGVTRALNMLEESQSEIMVAKTGLNGSEPLKNKKIAEILGLTVSEVRGRYYLARQKLRERLGIRQIIEGTEIMPAFWRRSYRQSSSQGEDSAPHNLPPFTVLDPETQTPAIQITSLPEGLLERVIKLDDGKLPGAGSEWYKLSQKAKALKVNRREVANGSEEVKAILEDSARWTLPMPTEWAEFVEKPEEQSGQEPAPD